jgi:hypothetical protein
MLRQLEDLDLERAMVEKQAEQMVHMAEDLAVQNKEIEKSRAESDFQAKHDELTGLPNRRYFLDQLDQVLAWFYGQLKLMLDRLASIPDGTGTLLDTTTILCVSEFGGPNANSTAAQHSPRNLPYVVIAGSGTPFRTGQSLSVDRTHGDYLLTLARGFGSMEARMGVGTGVIDGMLV